MSESTRQIEQINSLESGKGLQYLLNESYKILENPLVLFNMEYKLLSYSRDIVTDDWIWNEIVENGIFSNKTIEFFKDADFLDTAASTKSIALLTSANLKYDRLYGRIFNSDNSTVADLVLMASNRPFRDDDPIVFEALCEKISNEVSASEFYQQYGVAYHETLICELLGSHIADKIIYSDHVANLYEGLKANLFVAVVDTSKCNIKNNSLENYRDLFKRMQPELKYAIYSNYIVIIVSTDDMALDVTKDFIKLSELFEQSNIYAGVSNSFENLFDLRKYYKEAVDALTRGLESNCCKRIFLYNDCKGE